MTDPTRPPTILGIDPATRCGWAVSRGGKIVESGWRELTDHVIRGAYWPGLRVKRMAGLLDELHRRFNFDEVVSELAHVSHPSAAIPIAELQGVIKLWCELRRITWSGVTPAAVKKFATGKGNAKKPAMVAAAKRKWRRVFDDNEADARWIAEYGANG